MARFAFQKQLQKIGDIVCFSRFKSHGIGQPELQLPSLVFPQSIKTLLSEWQLLCNKKQQSILGLLQNEVE